MAIVNLLRHILDRCWNAAVPVETVDAADCSYCGAGDPADDRYCMGCGFQGW